MPDSIELDPARRDVFHSAVAAMTAFKRAFGRNLDAGFVAELYAADLLGLKLCTGANAPGHDAVGPNGERYQIKLRYAQNVDLNNFDFDYLVLVNLDDAYLLVGMWRITAAQAREVFTWREGFRKWQATQKQVKALGERVD